jgi:arylsulfatase A-like enzyme
VPKPNFVYIVADDLGYADLGCYGGRPAKFGAVSPNIDRLAAGGMRLTQGYSNSPVCSPTRFALMTMRYQYRLRGAAEEPITPASKGDPRLGLAPEHPTLPGLLRESGWKTALVGKWHLGYSPHFGPLRSGYDEFFGPMSGGVDYFTHCGPDGEHDVYEGECPRRCTGYLTDLLSERAVRFIERMGREKSPFFLSLHYTAPHWPWEAREDGPRAPGLHRRLPDLEGGSIETYRRMIHQMDEGIGAVMHALDAARVLRNTLVAFTSDNGGERFSDNWPLVGGKMDLTEGGIRVPWIAHWPAVIAPGAVCEQTCMTMDWSATVLEMAGVASHPGYPPDGVSLSRVLHDARACFNRELHWRMKHRTQRAMRDGDWKYLCVDDHEYLFNLRADERERANHAKRETGLLASMRSAWERWNDGMPAIDEAATATVVYTHEDMPAK